MKSLPSKGKGTEVGGDRGEANQMPKVSFTNPPGILIYVFPSPASPIFLQGIPSLWAFGQPWHCSTSLAPSGVIAVGRTELGLGQLR